MLDLEKTDEQGRQSSLNPPRKAGALTIAVLMCATLDVIAAPSGGVVTQGEAVISTPVPDTTQIDQSTHNAVIEWQDFSVQAHESAVFNVPDANSMTLNRVVGSNLSEIFGSLSSNGRLILVNPNGIVFGAGAQVDVNGLIASTLNIDDADFLDGALIFRQGDGQFLGKVVNYGSINANEGFVALAAPRVENHGVITANKGQIALGAGTMATIDFDGDGKLLFAVSGDVPVIDVDGSSFEGGVNNTGNLIANGGRIVLSASAANDVIDRVINVDGLVRANTVDETAGDIRLMAGTGTMQIAGLIEATGLESGQDGGYVEVTAREIEIVDGAEINVSASRDAGDILVGGDRLGQNAGTERGLEGLGKIVEHDVSHADKLVIEDGAVFKADSIDTGDGGNIVTWSDSHTDNAGSFSVKGGQHKGDGGMVEVSSLDYLDFSNMKVNADAPAGQGGQIVIDPTDTINQATADSLETQLQAADVTFVLGAAGNDIAFADNVLLSVSSVSGSPSDLDLRTLTFTTTGDITFGENSKIILDFLHSELRLIGSNVIFSKDDARLQADNILIQATSDVDFFGEDILIQGIASAGDSDSILKINSSDVNIVDKDFGAANAASQDTVRPIAFADFGQIDMLTEQFSGVTSGSLDFRTLELKITGPGAANPTQVTLGGASFPVDFDDTIDSYDPGGGSVNIALENPNEPRNNIHLENAKIKIDSTVTRTENLGLVFSGNTGIDLDGDTGTVNIGKLIFDDAMLALVGSVTFSNQDTKTTATPAGISRASKVILAKDATSPIDPSFSLNNGVQQIDIADTTDTSILVGFTRPAGGFGSITITTSYSGDTLNYGSGYSTTGQQSFLAVNANVDADLQGTVASRFDLRSLNMLLEGTTGTITFGSILEPAADSSVIFNNFNTTNRVEIDGRGDKSTIYTRGTLTIRDATNSTGFVVDGINSSANNLADQVRLNGSFDLRLIYDGNAVAQYEVASVSGLDESLNREDFRLRLQNTSSISVLGSRIDKIGAFTLDVENTGGLQFTWAGDADAEDVTVNLSNQSFAAFASSGTGYVFHTSAGGTAGDITFNGGTTGEIRLFEGFGDTVIIEGYDDFIVNATSTALRFDQGVIKANKFDIDVSAISQDTTLLTLTTGFVIQSGAPSGQSTFKSTASSNFEQIIRSESAASQTILFDGYVGATTTQIDLDLNASDTVVFNNGTTNTIGFTKNASSSPLRFIFNAGATTHFLGGTSLGNDNTFTMNGATASNNQIGGTLITIGTLNHGNNNNTLNGLFSFANAINMSGGTLTLNVTTDTTIPTVSATGTPVLDINAPGYKVSAGGTITGVGMDILADTIDFNNNIYNGGTTHDLIMQFNSLVDPMSSVTARNVLLTGDGTAGGDAVVLNGYTLSTDSVYTIAGTLRLKDMKANNLILDFSPNSVPVFELDNVIFTGTSTVVGNTGANAFRNGVDIANSLQLTTTGNTSFDDDGTLAGTVNITSGTISSTTDAVVRSDSGSVSLTTTGGDLALPGINSNASVVISSSGKVTKNNSFDIVSNNNGSMLINETIDINGATRFIANGTGANVGAQVNIGNLEFVGDYRADIVSTGIFGVVNIAGVNTGSYLGGTLPQNTNRELYVTALGPVNFTGTVKDLKTLDVDNTAGLQSINMQAINNVYDVNMDSGAATTLRDLTGSGTVDVNAGGFVHLLNNVDGITSLVVVANDIETKSITNITGATVVLDANNNKVVVDGNLSNLSGLDIDSVFGVDINGSISNITGAAGVDIRDTASNGDGIDVSGTISGISTGPLKMVATKEIDIHGTISSVNSIDFDLNGGTAINTVAITNVTGANGVAMNTTGTGSINITGDMTNITGGATALVSNNLLTAANFSNLRSLKLQSVNSINAGNISTITTATGVDIDQTGANTAQNNIGTITSVSGPVNANVTGDLDINTITSINGGTIVGGTGLRVGYNNGTSSFSGAANTNFGTLNLQTTGGNITTNNFSSGTPNTKIGTLNINAVGAISTGTLTDLVTADFDSTGNTSIGAALRLTTLDVNTTNAPGGNIITSTINEVTNLILNSGGTTNTGTLTDVTTANLDSKGNTTIGAALRLTTLDVNSTNAPGGNIITSTINDVTNLILNSGGTTNTGTLTDVTTANLDSKGNTTIGAALRLTTLDVNTTNAPGGNIVTSTINEVDSLRLNSGGTTTGTNYTTVRAIDIDSVGLVSLGTLNNSAIVIDTNPLTTDPITTLNIDTTTGGIDITTITGFNAQKDAQQFVVPGTGLVKLNSADILQVDNITNSSFIDLDAADTMTLGTLTNLRSVDARTSAGAGIVTGNISTITGDYIFAPPFAPSAQNNTGDLRIISDGTLQTGSISTVNDEVILSAKGNLTVTGTASQLGKLDISTTNSGNVQTAAISNINSGFTRINSAGTLTTGALTTHQALDFDAASTMNIASIATISGNDLFVGEAANSVDINGQGAVVIGTVTNVLKDSGLDADGVAQVNDGTEIPFSVIGDGVTIGNVNGINEADAGVAPFVINSSNTVVLNDLNIGGKIDVTAGYTDLTNTTRHAIILNSDTDTNFEQKYLGTLTIPADRTVKGKNLDLYALNNQGFDLTLISDTNAGDKIDLAFGSTGTGKTKFESLEVNFNGGDWLQGDLVITPFVDGANDLFVPIVVNNNGANINSVDRVEIFARDINGNYIGDPLILTSFNDLDGTYGTRNNGTATLRAPNITGNVANVENANFTATDIINGVISSDMSAITGNITLNAQYITGTIGGNNVNITVGRELSSNIKSTGNVYADARPFGKISSETIEADGNISLFSDLEIISGTVRSNGGRLTLDAPLILIDFMYASQGMSIDAITAQGVYNGSLQILITNGNSFFVSPEIIANGFLADLTNLLRGFDSAAGLEAVELSSRTIDLYRYMIGYYGVLDAIKDAQASAFATIIAGIIDNQYRTRTDMMPAESVPWNPTLTIEPPTIRPTVNMLDELGA